MTIKPLNMNKVAFISLIVVCALALGFYCYGKLFFTGIFGKKYTRKELNKNFIQHEKDFSDLVILFNSRNSEGKEHIVSFGLGKGNKIKLRINPSVIDPKNAIIGGDNLEIGSPKLDSALTMLGWTNETIKLLRDKLFKTNCDWIRSTQIYGDPIEMYPDQGGWSSYVYRIFSMPLSDSLIQIHGKPISNSEFGKRTVLEYSSAL